MLLKKQPVISVGILNASEIKFQFNGIFRCSNGLKYTGKRKVAIYRQGSILFDGDTFEEVLFTPINKEACFELKDVVIGLDFHWQRRETLQFSGKLKLICENGKLTAINLVNTEEYLASVISSEMNSQASVELLKAHAVISRSWLLNPILNKRKKKDLHYFPSMIREQNPETGLLEYTKWYEREQHKNYHVCADDHCQRYQGITKATSPNVLAAIEATAGEVLMKDTSICDARFSKSCGGATEQFENCWAPVAHSYLVHTQDCKDKNQTIDLTVEENAQKWIRESPDAFCNTTDADILSQVLVNYDQETTDFYRWKVEYTQEELAEIIQQRSGFNFGKIIDLIPEQRGTSGRIIKLRVVGTNQTVVVGKELEIRKWLSKSHLYSSAFVVDTAELVDGVPQKFCITGAGWGHGVGLCQIGAAVMGEKGYSYQEILQHYFDSAELNRIY